MIRTVTAAAALCLSSLSLSLSAVSFEVNVAWRATEPMLSSINGSTSYQQVFNAAYVQPTKGTKMKSGLIVRSQNCDAEVGGTCVFCGGSAEKASVLTFAEFKDHGVVFVDESKVVFGPYDETDSWGTEDPRIQYNEADQLYYMFYTAYNGKDIMLSLATSKDPTSPDLWSRRGPVFPGTQGSKSGALLLRNSPPHYLLWGDHDIRVAQSNDAAVWPDQGEILLSPREDKFDSRLVESGPPPMLLSNGDYLFFYNSAQLGWPDDPNTAYHVGWAILSGEDPSIVLARSDTPLMGPEFTWETGVAPYTCNVPNVVFLEGARPLGNDGFLVFFGAADANIGSAVIEVVIA